MGSPEGWCIVCAVSLLSIQLLLAFKRLPLLRSPLRVSSLLFCGRIHPPPPAPSKCLPHSQSLVCMFWINECVEWRPSLIAPSLKLASPNSKLLCVRGWTKPPYSFAVAASLFGLCHVPSDMISGVHWPALASLATRGYFRPTLDGSSLVMPA